MCNVKSEVGVYVVNFGFTSAVLSGTLDEVKSFADKELGFTQRDVVICKADVPVDEFNKTAEKDSPWGLITQDNQEEVAERVWWNDGSSIEEVEEYYGDRKNEVIFFGTCGYYAPWEEWG